MILHQTQTQTNILMTDQERLAKLRARLDGDDRLFLPGVLPQAKMCVFVLARCGSKTGYAPEWGVWLTGNLYHPEFENVPFVVDFGNVAIRDIIDISIEDYLSIVHQDHGWEAYVATAREMQTSDYVDGVLRYLECCDVLCYDLAMLLQVSGPYDPQVEAARRDGPTNEWVSKIKELPL